MGHLVRCPTCSGSMSSNADRCPHCGETDFLKEVGPGERVTCYKCKGTGRVWLHTPLKYSSGSNEFVKGSGTSGWFDCQHCSGKGSYTLPPRTIDTRTP